MTALVSCRHLVHVLSTCTAAPESSLPSMIHMKCWTSEKYTPISVFFQSLLDHFAVNNHTKEKCLLACLLLLSLRGRAWRTEVGFYWSSLQNWQISQSTRVMTSHQMTCWWLRWGTVINLIIHADNRHLPSVFFISSTEISQEKEVLPLRRVLLRHAPTGRWRCHPVWGQHW